MTLFKLTLLITSLFILTSCKSQISLPKNLDEAILFFKQKWTKDELNQFKIKPEGDAVADLHFEAGMWIRNNWIHGERDTALISYFRTLGIYHSDDISSIILTSLHRSLNNKDIKLDKQIEDYKAYWRPIIECNEKQKAKAVSVYNKLKEGDNITICMPVDTSNGSRNAVQYNCPTTEWTFDAAKDLLVKGTITQKYFINDTANVFFKVHINYLNRKDTPIFMTKVKIGDEKEFSLTGLKIE